MKIATAFLVALLSFTGISRSYAQDVPVLTASVDGNSPSVFPGAQRGSLDVDIARVKLTASLGDIYFDGFYMASDTPNGLSNFTDIKIYDVSTGSFLGYNANSNLVHIGNVVLGNGQTKTYLIRASIASSADGSFRLGVGSVSALTSPAPQLVGFPILSAVLTLPGAAATPLPVTSISPAPTPVPITTPTPTPNGFSSLAILGLREGDMVSASGSADPDIYIVNEWGYKRLFLNPVIFSFYSHLGGFSNVKAVSSTTRDLLRTASYFRNCETNDPKIYSLQVTGEDVGELHWLNVTGERAVQEDSDFFKKVFCINSKEFSWYAKGAAYTSVAAIPSYQR